ncbi:hypothetical protein ACVIGB_001039 [Bradyrhizobium sp. USDA 4341]
MWIKHGHDVDSLLKRQSACDCLSSAGGQQFGQLIPRQFTARVGLGTQQFAEFHDRIPDLVGVGPRQGHLDTKLLEELSWTDVHLPGE